MHQSKNIHKHVWLMAHVETMDALSVFLLELEPGEEILG